MTARAAARLAWAVALLSFAIVMSSLALLSRAVIHAAGVTGILSNLATGVTFAALGGLLASRRRENPIGWLLLGLGVVAGLSGLSETLTLHALFGGASPDGWVRWPSWLGNWVGNLNLGTAALLLLLFPDGKPLTRRWGTLARIVVVTAVGYSVGYALDPTPVKLPLGLPSVGNPVGVRAFKGFSNSPAFFVVFLVLILALVGLFVRLRRSKGVERQQLKWFAYVSGIALGGLMGGLLLYLVHLQGLSNALWYTALTGFGIGLPVATAIAILRYRLYAIDRIINRTLVYGALTVVLAAVYVGLAVGLGSLVRSNNSIVVAGSTLIVAALFRPARRRFQAFIDRRFYRRKYDAARTLEAFSARLRDEVDLDELSGHLVEVVHETMQPSQASLWIREAAT